MPDDRSQRERMLAGDDYLADEPQLVEERARAVRLLESFNASPALDPLRRRQILKELLGSLGDDVEVLPPLHCDYGYHVTIGARTFINVGLVALDVAAITIGEDVQLGPNVQLLTPTHPLDPERRRAKWEGGRPITIGNNVWLGGGVIVLPGVTIGADTVVGAGSVVSRDLPARVVAVGNPARVIRTL